MSSFYSSKYSLGANAIAAAWTAVSSWNVYAVHFSQNSLVFSISYNALNMARAEYKTRLKFFYLIDYTDLNIQYRILVICLVKIQTVLLKTASITR